MIQFLALACLLGWAGQADAQQISGLTNAFAVADSAGNSYMASVASGNNGFFVQISKLGPQGSQPLWTQSFSIGNLSAPGGIALDSSGDVYVAVNDLGAAASALVKYDASGVFISSRTAPFAGPSFSPLLSGLAFDPNLQRLYTAETFLDPNHGRLQSVLALEYDAQLNPSTSQTINDGSGLADVATGLVLDSSGDVSVGVLQIAGGSESPNLFVIQFSPGLDRLLSRQTTSNPPGFIKDVAVEQGPLEVSLQWSPGPAPQCGLNNLDIEPDFNFRPLCPTNDQTSPPTFLQGFLCGVSNGTSPGCLMPDPMIYANSNPSPGGYFFGAFTLVCPQIFCAFPFVCAPASATLTVSVGGVVVDQQRAAPTCSGNICFCTRLGSSVTILPKAVRNTLAIVSGSNNQQGTVTEALPQPLQVKVADGSGHPQSGVAVGFAVTSAPTGATGQTLSAPNATDSNGIASTNMTLGNVPGTYQVTATCAQCSPTTVAFTETALPFVLQLKLTPGSIFPSGTAQANTQVTDASGKGVSGQQINFSAQAVQNSGGHDHDHTRPIGTFNQSTCTTDSNGNCSVQYSASPFGGTEKINASSAGSPGASTALSVMVPDLVELQPSVAPKIYNLTGSFGQPGVTSMHTRNHFSTTITQTMITVIAADYLEATGDLLGINDMSLVNGGLFDILNDWNTPHQLHRVGHSTDISIPVQDSPTGQFTDVPCSDDEVLLQIVKDVTGNPKNLKCERGGRKHVEIPQSN